MKTKKPKKKTIPELDPTKAQVMKRATTSSNLDEVFAMVDTPEGKKRALAEIHRHKGPIYDTDPAAPGVVVEILHDGTQRRGKFVNRHFVPFSE